MRLTAELVLQVPAFTGESVPAPTGIVYPTEAEYELCRILGDAVD
jgi:hypothetical protein